MKKNLIAIACGAAALGALAMPTPTELKEAQPLVVELMSKDMADYKAKDKTAAEIGDISCQYAKEAKSEAMKFILLKGAVSYYVRGGSYDKAADAISRLRQEIKNIPPSTVEGILRKNTAKASAKQAPRLYAQLRLAKVQSTAFRAITDLKEAVAKKPDSIALLRQLAEARALSGNWSGALDTFVKIPGELGEMAKAEQAGEKLPDVADFWWGYVSSFKEKDGGLFKAHAAEIYRNCLSSGQIDGLQKKIVENRISEYEPLVKELQAPPLFAFAKTYGQTKALAIGGKRPLEFVSCPPGEYTMGFGNLQSCLKAHQVKISRPFWIAKYPLTYGQWDALMGPQPRLTVERNDSIRLDVLGGDDTPAALTYNQALAVLTDLNQKYLKELPPGYIFRLATEAEYEYVVKSGRSSYNIKTDGQGETTTLAERLQAMRDKHMEPQGWEKDPWRIPYTAVGMKKPNMWGVSDMLTLGWAYLLDTVRANRQSDTEVMTPYYRDQDVDPVLNGVGSGRQLMCVARGVGWGYDCKFMGHAWIKFLMTMGDKRHEDCVLRIVIGPDLLKERAKP